MNVLCSQQGEESGTDAPIVEGVKAHDPASLADLLALLLGEGAIAYKRDVVRRVQDAAHLVARTPQEICGGAKIARVPQRHWVALAVDEPLVCPGGGAIREEVRQDGVLAEQAVHGVYALPCPLGQPVALAVAHLLEAVLVHEAEAALSG